MSVTSVARRIIWQLATTRNREVAMTTTTNLANVPAPAGAVSISDWYDTDTPNPGRYFRGSSWVIERNNRNTDMCLQVDGTLWGDGGPSASSR
jgi:hypothetical protein